MKTMSSLVRGPACAAMALTLAFGTAGILAAAGTVQEADVAADSQLELLERADSGAYQRYSVKLTLADGVATLAADKDGEKVQAQVPVDDALALWRELLGADLETLRDASPEQAVPDQSRFNVTFRVKDAQGGFSAYGVDSLTDGRYRQIVRAILKLADQVGRARK